LGGSLRISPFDELAAERRLPDEENDDGRLEFDVVDGFKLAEFVVVVVVLDVSDDDGIISLI
jgi:hypothetical protein